MSYAIRIDGQGWRAVNDAADIDSATEVFSASQPSAIVPGAEVSINAVRALREIVLGRLEGIASRATRAGDTTGIAAACDEAAVALLDITVAPAVLAATDGPSAKAALIAEWSKISTTLATSAPAAANAFSGLSLV